jgi:hypothetical protein
MRQYCASCFRSYDDEFCSTVCPHKGDGYCAVCDCVVCLCTTEQCSDWERSANNREREKNEAV